MWITYMYKENIFTQLILTLHVHTCVINIDIQFSIFIDLHVAYTTINYPVYNIMDNMGKKKSN